MLKELTGMNNKVIILPVCIRHGNVLIQQTTLPYNVTIYISTVEYSENIIYH